MTSNSTVVANQDHSSTTHSGVFSTLRRLDDKGLIAEAKRGHRAAFDALWQPHAKRILATTFRITRNREDAEDALQDSLLSAYVHIGNFDGRARFSTWLMRIAINSALMTLRKKRSAMEWSIDDPAVHEETPVFASLVDLAPTPEMQYAQIERGEILRNAIRALRPSIRKALELQTLRQNSLKETADMMGASVTATKSRIHHGKAELRGSLLSRNRRNRTSRQFRLPPAV